MLFSKYPYVNFSDYNLDWIIYKIKKLQEELINFVNLNTIKYADPIQWNITRQYEANTVVVDPYNGNAYISTKPVPTGVQITNEDYWTEIYNYQNTINTLKSQINGFIEDTFNASRNYEQGDVIWIKDKLYIATTDIGVGAVFVENGNVENITVISLLQNQINRFNAIYFDSVDGMKSFNLKDGEYAITTGYYYNSDGGGCIYKVVAASDSSFAIELDNGLKCVPVINGDVNIAMFGGVSGEIADYADSFYKMLDYCIEYKKRIAKVPTGNYPVTNAISIPSNVTLIGEGNDSFIYESSSNVLGATLTTGGSNCGIKNIRVGHLESNVPVIIGTAHSGGIGIGAYTYDSIKNKTYDSFNDNIRNIIIENIYCTDNYPIQIESTRATIENVKIKNVYSPRGVVRATPQLNGVFKNFEYSDIVCDALVIGVGGGTLRNSIFKNIECNYFRYYVGNVSNNIFESLRVKTEANSEFGPANNMEVAAFIQADGTFYNCHFENGNSLNFGIQIYYGITNWFNCSCDGFSRFNIFNNQNKQMNCFNCYFGKTVQSYMTGIGYNTASNPQGGVVGGAVYYDDDTIFSAPLTITSPIAVVSSLTPATVKRIGKVAKITALLMGTLSQDTEIGRVPYDSWKPKSEQRFMARAFTNDKTIDHAVIIKIDTDGVLKVDWKQQTTGAASTAYDRIVIDGTYFI